MTLRQRYRYQVVVAAGMAATFLPYVLLTDASASAAVILVHAIPLWIVTPPLVAAADQLTAPAFDRPGFAGIGVRLAGVWAALAVASAAMVMVVHFGTNLGWSLLLVPQLANALVPVFSAYALVVLFEAWRRQERRALALEAAEAKARWAALAARIQPHFLFNSLASLEPLIEADPARATVYLRRLASLFRLLVDGGDVPLRALGTEIDMVRNYLHVQETRHGDRLRSVVSVPDGLATQAIPPTLLLTLVENAVRHGIETRPEGGEVTISAAVHGSRVELRVMNPAGMDSGPAAYGHTDVRERLRLALGDASAFTFAVKGGMAEAVVVLPARSV